MRRLLLDQWGIPTGQEEGYGGLEDELGQRDFDDGFALLEESAEFSVSSGGRRISMELLEGFPNAQVFAPKSKDYIAFEPMTAPANALISGEGLRLVEPHGQFRAIFRIRIDRDPRSFTRGRT